MAKTDFTFIDGDDQTGNGTSDPVTIDKFNICPTVHVYGTFVADVQVQISLNGSRFGDYGDAVSDLTDGDGFVAIPNCLQVQVVVAGYESGTVQWCVGGTARA